MTPKQIGWVDEYGNLFPMGAWVPSKRTYHDDHRVPWQPVYTTADGLMDLLRDANRYRWLRAQHWWDGKLSVVHDPKNAIKLGSYSPSEGLLDDLVDSEMALQEANNV